MIGVIVVLILTLLGMVENDVEWTVFPGIAVIIGIYLTISLWADGSITELSGGTATVIASASTATTSAWQFISLIPMMFTIAAGLIAAYKVGKAF